MLPKSSPGNVRRTVGSSSCRGSEISGAAPAGNPVRKHTPRERGGAALALLSLQEIFCSCKFSLSQGVSSRVSDVRAVQVPLLVHKTPDRHLTHKTNN